MDPPNTPENCSTGLFMAAVKPRRVHAQEPLHSRDQIPGWRLDHRVKMVSHEAIREHLPLGLLTTFTQGLDEKFSIAVVVKDRFHWGDFFPGHAPNL
jgi:hypothetical protein